MFLMNALQTDQPTDQQTDTAYYRDARTHLKRTDVRKRKDRYKRKKKRTDVRERKKDRYKRKKKRTDVRKRKKGQM